MPNLDVIAFDCPRCLHNFRVAKNRAGTRIVCPKCDMPLAAPDQTAGDDGRSNDTGELTGSDSRLISSDDEQVGQADLLSNNRNREASVDPIDDSNPLADLVIPDRTSLAEPNPDTGKNPFKVDPDAPLIVDGVGDLFSNADVFGTKCHVCDTRIHVRPAQIGTEVECPICYSIVKVKALEEETSLRWGTQKRESDDGKSCSTMSHIVHDEELKLSEPIKRPKVEIDPSWGLAPVQDDLLAPKPKTRQLPQGTSFEDVPELVVVDDSLGGESDKAESSTATRQSKRWKSDQRIANSDSSSTPQSKTRTSSPVERSIDDGQQDFPDFELMELLNSAVEMIRSPGVLLRVGIAFGLMCFGAISMEWISPAYQEVVEGSEASMLTRLVVSAKWLVAGAVYLLGLAVLWWTSSYLFRDAALGKRSVSRWSSAGTNEILSTFLLFAFGFFIGGLPAAVFSLMVMPLRVLLGPLFLLSAWYNQSPFAIVSVDAFQSASENVGQWRTFYMFSGGLAFLSVIAGIIFWMRAVLPFSVGLLAIILGIAICITVTLLFAAVCGWHCGRVVESLENSDR